MTHLGRGHIAIDGLFEGRARKPRMSALMCVTDDGAPLALFAEVVRSHGGLVDLMKLGSCTALLQDRLMEKVEVLREADVPFHFGGTLFEKAVLGDRIVEYVAMLRRCGCRHVEISDATILLPREVKLAHIANFAAEFTVLAEVGAKAPGRSARMSPEDWVEELHETLDAGASYAVIETGGSGRSGLCREDGSIRHGVLAAILADGPPAERIIFEAANRRLQAEIFRRVGSDANLANVPLLDVIGAETLRLGLSPDTMLHAAR
ncbi:MAG TPA: phosphosulfolactate synthase [Thermoleophilaceae bacterium]|jgi:phosphosulfolactate synthase